MYEETNPPDIDSSVVRSVIHRCFPSIENPTIDFLYHGTYNVYEVEGEFIFRFPSTVLPASERSRLVKREAEILNLLREHLSVRIPAPEFVDSWQDNPYMGYRKIPGASLSRQYDTIPTEQQVLIAEWVGIFLGELHSLDLGPLSQRYPDFSLDTITYRKYWNEFYRRVEEIVYPTLSKNKIEWSEKLFHTFLDLDENFEFSPVLVHGDFDTSNILVDPETFQVTGIIDFEETGMYDPAYDLQFLGEGVGFQTALLRSYPRELDNYISQRITFLSGRAPFDYILSGIDLGVESLAAAGYQMLDDTVSNWSHYTSVVTRSFAALSK